MSPNFSTTQVHMMKRNQSLALPGDAVFPDDEAWVIGNVKQYGYYRVNYDQTNWNALINQLNTDHTAIDVINRAQIINDAWNLGKSGELDQNTALSTVEYLSKEEDYVPWVAATEQLDYVDDMLTRSSLYGAFQYDGWHTVISINFDRHYHESVNLNLIASHRYMRSLISNLACKNGIEECVDNASVEFNTWMTTSNNPINPNLKSTAYCEAIAAGGVEEWDFAYGQYKVANVAAEKSRLLFGLSCSREPWILSRYLTYCLNPDEIRKQDSVSSIVSIASNPIGRSLAWDFMRDQWDYITNDYGTGAFSISRLISGITSSFNTEFALQQLRDFMVFHPDLGSGQTAFDQAIEKTNGNIKWMEKNENVIRDWLKSLGFE